MSRITHKGCRGAFFTLLAFFLLMAVGCAPKRGAVPVVSADSASGTGAAPPIDYTLEDFSDIPVPVDLEWERDRSMYIRTESFAGGILKFSGRVEVDSLTDYFIRALPKKGWKLVGSARYKNSMLSFTKPDKTCTINIIETGITSKTEVYIYVADDISRRQNQGFRTPFGEETLK